jgi:ribonuclease H2 subunit C
MLPQESQTPQYGEVDREEPAFEVGVIEEKANFEELVVWGHELLPYGTEDLYVRSLEEWIMFSKQVS